MRTDNELEQEELIMLVHGMGTNCSRITPVPSSLKDDDEGAKLLDLACKAPLTGPSKTIPQHGLFLRPQVDDVRLPPPPRLQMRPRSRGRHRPHGLGRSADGSDHREEVSRGAEACCEA